MFANFAPKKKCHPTNKKQKLQNLLFMKFKFFKARSHINRTIHVEQLKNNYVHFQVKLQVYSKGVDKMLPRNLKFNQ